MIVKITRTPPGEAPLWVRAQWVGATLHGKSFEGDVLNIVSRDFHGEEAGIAVDTVEAIGTLKHHNFEAWAWWTGWWQGSQGKISQLVFPLECYELVEV